MSVLDLVGPDDPILLKKTETFDFSNPPIDVEQLCHDLVDTVKSKGGMGLSANQVGLPYRVFVMDASPPFVCFNPRIVDHSSTTNILDEGCLSFPGLVLKVPRWESIKVRFATPNGEVTTKTFIGMTARCFQHELMHLDGRLFFEGVGRMKMDKALKRAEKFGFDYTRLGLMKEAVKK